jgi:copper(I)-binding protein
LNATRCDAGCSLDIADKVEVHETIMENNVAKMGPATGGMSR